MAFMNWSWSQWLGGTTTAGPTTGASTTVCFACSSHYSTGGTHLCGAQQQQAQLGNCTWLTQPVVVTQAMSWQQPVLQPVRPKLTKLTITGTAVILEDEYGNGLEIDLDVLRRLMNFDEVEALAVCDALRR